MITIASRASNKTVVTCTPVPYPTDYTMQRLYAPTVRLIIKKQILLEKNPLFLYSI